MWIRYNPNPCLKSTGDCSVRALTKALDVDWYKAYELQCLKGQSMCDMPSSNAVWGAVLRDYGYRQYTIPMCCSECYTIRDFCGDNPEGLYVLATGTHVVTIIDGDYYDSWDSGSEVPVYYWAQKEKKMAYNNMFPMNYQQFFPQQQAPQPAPQQQNNSMIWVSGEAGAKAYLVSPNTTVQLWDSEAPVVYLKSADASGMPTMKILDYKIREQALTQSAPVAEKVNINFVTHEELKILEDRLAAMIDELKGEFEDEYQPNADNATTTKSKK